MSTTLSKIEDFYNNWEYFRNKIVIKADKYDPTELVHAFIDTYYDTRHNPPTNNIKIRSDKHDNLFKRTRKQPQWIMKQFTNICDDLIEEEHRRRQGDYHTPPVWARESRKEMSKTWARWDEEPVWDCCCGTLNLTRDHAFKDLYCSTLNQADLDIGEEYNSEAKKFQYDFLNDELPRFMQDRFAILNYQRSSFTFFFNPPYVTATDKRLDTDINRKSGVANTSVNISMKKDKWGSCSEQLYAQFLYRIYCIHKSYPNIKIRIGVFTPGLFLSGSSYETFRKKFPFRIIGIPFQFPASYFTGTSKEWSLYFTMFELGQELENAWNLEVKDINDVTGCIRTEEIRPIYNLDNQVKASDWVRYPLKDLPVFDCPQVKNALSLIDNLKGQGKMLSAGFGYFHNNANAVYHNGTHVGLYSTGFHAGHGLPIGEVNFRLVTSLFSARKLILSTWLNQKDEYAAPNEDHPDYEQWNNDTIVYSLFNNSSNQSSLRDITYKDKQWDIQNEWFWMSNAEMRDLADAYGNDNVYRDTKRFNKERYVYKKLQEVTLSSDAQEILEMARELTKKSFACRDEMDNADELHLQAWDAGWYQIKRVLKEFFPEDLKQFVEKYRVFEDRMREGVYKFGFLLSV